MQVIICFLLLDSDIPVVECLECSGTYLVSKIGYTMNYI